MGWVKEALQQLEEKNTASVRPQGGSMKGRIESGQLVTITNDLKKLDTGDVIFVKWKNNYLLHLALEFTTDKVLIGNNLGKINGWISREDIIGKVIQIKD